MSGARGTMESKTDMAWAIVKLTAWELVIGVTGEALRHIVRMAFLITSYLRKEWSTVCFPSHGGVARSLWTL